MAVGPPWSPPLLHSGACRLVARLASCRGNAVPVFPQGRPVNSKLTSWLASPDTSGATTSRNVRPSIRGLAVQSSGNGSGKVVDTADRAKEGASLHIKGRLELITGPMFAGKTSELIKRASEEEVCARRVVVVKSKIDNRYSTDEVVTHDGLRRRCFAVSQMRDLRAILGTEAYNEVQVVAIDEAQFFSDLLEYCEAAVDLEHKTVLVAGLSGDYRRKPFGQVHELLPLADSVTVLQAKCALCKSGEPAIFTRRLADGDSVQLVGGADKYIPVCRHHYNQPVDISRS